MEKRLLAFLWTSVMVVIGFTMLQRALIGPLPKPAEVADGGAEPKVDKPPAMEDRDRLAPPREAADGSTEGASKDDGQQPRAGEGTAIRAPRRTQPPLRFVTLGSLDPASGYDMLVTIRSEGGAIERIELNSPRYRELEAKGGYLGHLALADDPAGGCRVQVVGPGTPAANATSKEHPEVGLRGPQFAIGPEGDPQLSTPGDRITQIDGKRISNRDAFAARLNRTRPNDTITLTVERTNEQGDTTTAEFVVTLTRHPLQLLRPEINATVGSFLLALVELGEVKVGLSEQELPLLPSLRSERWTVRDWNPEGAGSEQGVELRFALSPDDLQLLRLSGSWEFVKRFKLPKRGDTKTEPAKGFCLGLELEIANQGDEPQSIAFQWDGPSGLTDEGWWYSYKVHPTRFAAAGARDIIWRMPHDRHELFLCPAIAQHAEKNPKSPDKPMIDRAKAPVEMQYVGSDAQYFAVVMLPDPGHDLTDEFYSERPYEFQDAVAHMISTPDEKLPKRANVTFRLASRTTEVGGHDALRQRYIVFAGPKDRHVLASIGLEDCIVFGWFKAVARPMVLLLNGLYRVTGSFSYGLAIIALTVLVRGLMFPFGRKMALNAQKMQELAPEMKKIAEKYGDDLQKRGEAQRELFRKHNYNPFGGCVVMLFQLPIFVGLYRALSVDIELRQAPLIPGMSWCSNLAGPDMFLNWESWLWTPLSSRSGWLGPYLNVLPILSIVLMLVHQKLFTPPPQDDQQRTQQKVMTYMMLFFGVMFHKIAAGLCLYFIVSSAWGLAERKLLPKSAKPAESQSTAPVALSTGGNGKASQPRSKARRKGRK